MCVEAWICQTQLHNIAPILCIVLCRNAEGDFAIDLTQFNRSATINENPYADKLIDTPQQINNPTYGLEDDSKEKQEVMYSFIDRDNDEAQTANHCELAVEQSKL